MPLSVLFFSTAVVEESDGIGLQLVQRDHNLFSLLWLLLLLLDIVEFASICCAAENGSWNLDCIVHSDEADRFVGFGCLADSRVLSSLITRALLGTCCLGALRRSRLFHDSLHNLLSLGNERWLGLGRGSLFQHGYRLLSTLVAVASFAVSAQDWHWVDYGVSLCSKAAGTVRRGNYESRP